ncbi:MAG: ATP synthase F1 subunit gamma [Sediminibacterium sp.]|nr:ATP synthase F1 subunit gamma [Sediminibacterium sp.]
MPGQLKEVRQRISSTQSTQQITKAMKMVSAAKLRRAQENIILFRPYVQSLNAILQNVIADETDTNEVPFLKVRDVKKVLIILITSDRGLCGGYNANLVKLAKQTIQEKYPQQKIEIWHVGKKGFEAFTKLNYTQNSQFKDLFLQFNYQEVKKMSALAIQSFLDEKFDAIDLVYSEFRNAAFQISTCQPFLPITLPPKTSGFKADFIYEPSKNELLPNLIPQILTTQIYKALLEALASEHGARMTAMDKASENAQELLKSLKLSYNRARQAAITTELTEIVSGAAALNS